MFVKSLPLSQRWVLTVTTSVDIHPSSQIKRKHDKQLQSFKLIQMSTTPTFDFISLQMSIPTELNFISLLNSMFPEK